MTRTGENNADAEDVRYTWNRERWVIDRLVEAVDEGDADVKEKCGRHLLARYEGGEWRQWREIDSGRFLPLAELNPDQSDWSPSEVLEGGDTSEARLCELADGDDMTPSELMEWRDAIAASSLDPEAEPDWAVLEVKHSDPRRTACLAVTAWHRGGGNFVAAYSSHSEAMNALKQVGFTGRKDYLSRRTLLGESPNE